MDFSALVRRNPWRLIKGLAALLATQPIGAAAQAPADTLIYDTFRNGKSEWSWSIGSAPTQLAEMSHGSYRLRCVGADATNTASATLVVSLNDEQDWSFAARLRVQNRGGLYFGFKTSGPPLVSNYQVFTLELNRPVPVAPGQGVGMVRRRCRGRVEGPAVLGTRVWSLDSAVGAGSAR